VSQKTAKVGPTRKQSGKVVDAEATPVWNGMHSGFLNQLEEDVIAVRRTKRRTSTAESIVPGEQPKPDDLLIKGKRPLEVGNLKHHAADAGTGRKTKGFQGLRDL